MTYIIEISTIAYFDLKKIVDYASELSDIKNNSHTDVLDYVFLSWRFPRWKCTQA